jgi:hypothetical protein
MKTKIKSFQVYVTSDDPQCCGLLQFKAYSATLSKDKTSLTVDEAYEFVSFDGFRYLKEVE